jgi:mRNA interferase RelE/StbE
LAWTIEYADTAVKQLHKLDKAVTRRIADFLEKRIGSSTGPRGLGKSLKGHLGDLWCYPVGDYRIFCDLQDKTATVLVLQIGNRREVCR